MLSAIVTSDSIGVLAKRLAAWCTVVTGGDYFNFRCPDTQRLPAIFAVVMPEQQRELAGNVLSWHYMARNGVWAALPIDCCGPAAGIIRLQYGGAAWMACHQSGMICSERRCRWSANVVSTTLQH
jgi:hypothetical protein